MEIFGFSFKLYEVWSLIHFGVNIVRTCKINHKNATLEYQLESKGSCGP